MSLVVLIKWGNFEVRIVPPRRLRPRWSMQRLRFASEHFFHEESKALLVGVSKESGEKFPKSPYK